MKKFWKDYWELYKECFRFFKAHWLGSIIFGLVLALLYAICVFPNVLVAIWEVFSEKISAVFHKD